jgi:hypothetical protein
MAAGIFLFICIAGWLWLEAAIGYHLSRVCKKYTQRFGYIHWVLFLPLGLLTAYLLIILCTLHMH